MMRTATMTLLIVLSALPGCGEYLGEYKIEEVRLVQQLPADAVIGGQAPYREYLRIELSSQASLNRAETGPGLYTEADFCPDGGSGRMIAFGPVGTDGKAVESWRRNGFAPDPRDGRYRYWIYVVPNSPPRSRFSNSPIDIPAYDLRREKGDVCVRFFVPGYNIIPSRSENVRVAERLVARALNASAGSR